MSEQSPESVREEVLYQTMAKFLESTSPNQMVHISDLSIRQPGQYGSIDIFKVPEIQLHCTHDDCNGIRFHRCISGDKQRIESANFETFYVTYLCSNCQQKEKTFSLAAKIDSVGQPTGECYKFGELPPFGPPVPAKLISLVGPDRDEFLQGRCENQGLGVGAFTYYRRVVENQKK